MSTDTNTKEGFYLEISGKTSRDGLIERADLQLCDPIPSIGDELLLNDCELTEDRHRIVRRRRFTFRNNAILSVQLFTDESEYKDD